MRAEVCVFKISKLFQKKLLLAMFSSLFRKPTCYFSPNISNFTSFNVKLYIFDALKIDKLKICICKINQIN